jgi:hypothetical protein
MIGKPLSPPELEAAAVAVATGLSTANVLKKARMSRRTLARWKAAPEFHQRVNELRAELTRQCCGRFAASMSRAVRALVELLKSNNECVKLGAARQLLALGSNLRDSFEFEERMTNIEAKIHVPQTTGAKKCGAPRNGETR